MSSDVGPRIINVRLLPSHETSHPLPVTRTARSMCEQVKNVKDQSSDFFKEAEDDLPLQADKLDDLHDDLEEAARDKSPDDADNLADDFDDFADNRFHLGDELTDEPFLFDRAEFGFEGDVGGDGEIHETVVVQLVAGGSNGIGAPVVRRLLPVFPFLLLLLLAVTDGGRELMEPFFRGGFLGISGSPSEFVFLGFVEVECPVFFEGLLEETLLLVTKMRSATGFAFLFRDEEGHVGQTILRVFPTVVRVRKGVRVLRVLGHEAVFGRLRVVHVTFARRVEEWSRDGGRVRDRGEVW